MIGADHNAGLSLTADQLVGAVLADVIKGADFTIASLDAKQAFTRHFKSEIITRFL